MALAPSLKVKLIYILRKAIQLRLRLTISNHSSSIGSM